MARMFPPSLPLSVRENPSLNAEVRVYDALRENTSQKWTAYYSVKWLGSTHPDGPPRDGEADFILTHPKFGVIVLEVKGGAIRYEGRLMQWFSRDRHGASHDIDPIFQVVRSKKVFLGKLQDQPGWKARWVRIGHAVVFPDVLGSTLTLPPEVNSTIVIGSSDLGVLERRMAEVALSYSGVDPNKAYEDGPELVALVERLLVPFVKFPTLGTEVEFTEKMILKLTEEQYRLLDFLGGRRRAMIHGCAGSGKTVMAVEQARRLSELDGMKTVLLCHEPHLARELETRLGPGSSVHVRTLREFCVEAIGAGFAATSSLGIEDLAERAAQVFETSPGRRYDAIVVDEGQDFEESWWLAVVSALAEHGVFYVFMDDNQRVNASRADPPIGREDHYPLKDNVRNTGTIFGKIKAFYRGPAGARSRGPAGRPVATKPYRTTDELRSTVAELVRHLIDVEKFALGDVAVLTPRPPAESALTGLQAGSVRLTRGDAPRAGEVLLASVAGFKGLERPVGILAELDDAIAASELFNELCYVGFSRAKSHLILVGQPGVLSRLTGLPGE